MKVSSNPEIARSLRNGFRASLGWCRAGVERRNRRGGLRGLPGRTQLRIPRELVRESERGGEASRSRGEQPRPPTKAPKSTFSDQRKWDRGDSRDVGLEAAIISKVRNSLPVEPSRAENERGYASCRSRGSNSTSMVGERRRPAEKPHRRGAVERRRVRMPERVTTRWVGSPSAESTRFPGEGQSAQGQSGPKARPRGAADGHAVNIPRPGVEDEPRMTPRGRGSG